MTRFLLIFSLLLLFKVNLLANPGKNSTIYESLNSTQLASFQSITDPNHKNIIFWETSSTIGDAAPQFFLQRVEADGDLIWGKDVALSGKGQQIQSAHKMIADGANGVILVWEAKAPGSEDTDLYAQRIDSTGRKLWGEEGRLISTASGSQITPFLTGDGSGGAFIAWSDSRNDPTYNNWDIYAQHINGEGRSEWETDGIIISADQKDEFIGDILSSPGGGFTLVWNMVVPEITGLGEGYDFHSRRVDRKGEWIPSLNSTRFLALAAGNTNYNLGEILNDDNGGFFLSLISKNLNEEGSAVYIQHVLSSGQAAFQEDGILIDNTLADIKNLSYATDSLGNYTFSWSGRQDSSLITCISKVDRAGNVIADTITNDIAFPEIYTASNQTDSLPIISLPDLLTATDSTELPPVNVPDTSETGMARSAESSNIVIANVLTPAPEEQTAPADKAKIQAHNIKYVRVPLITLKQEVPFISSDSLSELPGVKFAIAKKSATSAWMYGIRKAKYSDSLPPGTKVEAAFRSSNSLYPLPD